MLFLHIKNNTKWFIVDKEHQNRLLQNEDYRVIEEEIIEEANEDIIEPIIETNEEVKETIDYDTLDFKEIQKMAKEKGIKCVGVKKDDLIKALKGSE